MLKRTKKALSVLLSAVFALSALVMPTVSASAAERFTLVTDVSRVPKEYSHSYPVEGKLVSNKADVSDAIKNWLQDGDEVMVWVIDTGTYSINLTRLSTLAVGRLGDYATKPYTFTLVTDLSRVPQKYAGSYPKDAELITDKSKVHKDVQELLGDGNEILLWKTAATWVYINLTTGALGSTNAGIDRTAGREKVDTSKINGDNLYDINSGKKPTLEQILSIAKKYDPDGYFFLSQEAIVKNDTVGVMFYFDDGTFKDYVNKFSDYIETAVHESCHINQHYPLYSTDSFYMGNGKTILVKVGKYFKTEEMTATIPQSLRTFRFGEYVDKGRTVTANVQGAYGLLHEFHAYYYGVKMQTSMLEYYKEHIKTWDQLWRYPSESTLQAYEEFKYWILQYLIYAKAKHPDVYAELMANKEWLEVYTEVDRRFAELIDYHKNVIIPAKTELAKKLGFDIMVTAGVSTSLNAELKKPDCVAMDKEIAAALKAAKAVKPADAPSSWAQSSVDISVTNRLVTAELYKNFQAPTTRAEFCRAAVNFLRRYGYDVDGVTPKTFADTTDKDIGIAAALKITGGTNAAGTTFTPNRALTREEAAAMIRNVMSVIGVKYDATAVKWADEKDISAYAKDAVNAVYNAKILGSMEAGKLTFSPKATYTHEQSIATFGKLWEYARK